MSKLMSVMGIILLAIGAALALVGLVNPAQMQVYGLTIDTAATLITGGILAVGLGGVIAALQNGIPAITTVQTETVNLAPVIVEEPAPVMAPVVVEPVPEVVLPPVAEEPPSRVRFNPFTRKTVTVSSGVAAGAAASVAVASEAVQNTSTAVLNSGKSAVDDTIAALEQAKADIANAVGGVAALGEEKVDDVIEDAAEDFVEEEDAAEEEAADGELYVVEERDIRGRPARILSDNTVEAETDEGWMRFENLEHLNEYMDAMEADA